MDITEMQREALEVRALYDSLNRANGHSVWDLPELVAGLIVDTGDLMRQTMILNGTRSGEEAAIKFEHELNDILWSVLCIADRAGINITTSFTQAMETLRQRVQSEMPISNIEQSAV